MQMLGGAKYYEEEKNGVQRDKKMVIRLVL